MTVFQHYYTAWYNSAHGSAGQQTKAESPGIPFNLESDPTWAAMKEYALPPGITDREIQRHPVALRYRPLGPDLALLVHYASIGIGADVERTSSEVRYGNMFVHTLVLPPQDFIRGDPIQYWGSGFWQSEDVETSRHDLPALQALDIEPTLTLPQVVSFVQKQPTGWDKLMTLLSAVIGNVRNPRPVLIVDEPEAVAHWIAGVSLLLPPPNRPLLSFSTYSHSYPSGYMMTGLHPKQFAQMRTAQDFRDYFVLDGDQNGNHSDIGLDAYAQFATECLRDGAYESALNPLFQIARERFRAPVTVADNLKTVISTRTLFASSRTIPYTSDEISALSEFVSAEIAESTADDSDMRFLRSLHTICLRAVVWSLAPMPLEPYQQIVGVMVRRNASQWAQELAVDLCTALDLLTQGATQRPKEIADALSRACPSVEHAAALARQPQWAKALTEHTSLSIPIHLRVWDMLGRYITPTSTPSVWLQATLKAAFGNVSEKHNKEQESLERLLHERCSPYALEWAACIGELRDPIDPKTTMYIEQFYYNCLVLNVWPPSARASVRELISKVAPHVSNAEAYEDLRKRAGVDGKYASDILDHWFALNGKVPVQWTDVIDRFALLSQISSSFVPRGVAAALLARTDVSTEAAVTLAETVIQAMQFCCMSRDEERVCSLWHDDVRLTPPSREFASIVIRARQSRATPKDVDSLKRKLFKDIVSSRQYSHRCEQYLWQRIISGDAGTSHASDVQILYQHKWSATFWKAYWPVFDRVLFDTSQENVLIALLSFWHERAQRDLGFTGYTESEFMRQFTAHLDACAAAQKSALADVYARLDKRKPSPRWLADVLQLMKKAIDKRRWPQGHRW